MAELVRHRQTKGSATDRPHLNHRATPRLHNVGITKTENRNIHFGAGPLTAAGSPPLLKHRVIIRELPSEFFAKGQILSELLNFAMVGRLCFLRIFPSLDGSGILPLHFEE